MAKKFDEVSRRPCSGEAARVRLRKPATREGEAEKWKLTVGEGCKTGGIGAGGGGGLAVRSSADKGRDGHTSGAGLEQLEPVERTRGGRR